MKSFKDKLAKFNREDYGKLNWKITRSYCKGVVIINLNAHTAYTLVIMIIYL
jgi:hypothetical protein